jgi:hypothetical protein
MLVGREFGLVGHEESPSSLKKKRMDTKPEVSSITNGNIGHEKNQEEIFEIPSKKLS